MAKQPPKPLELWQQDDAKRLKALYDEKIVPNMSQEQFGSTYEIGTPGMVWQYISGHRPLNIKAAVLFAKGLGCKIEEFSPTIANEITEAMAHARKISLADDADTELHRLSRAEVHIVTRYRLTDETGQGDILDRVNTVPMRGVALPPPVAVPVPKRKGDGQ